MYIKPLDNIDEVTITWFGFILSAINRKLLFWKHLYWILIKHHFPRVMLHGQGSCLIKAKLPFIEGIHLLSYWNAKWIGRNRNHCDSRWIQAARLLAWPLLMIPQGMWFGVRNWNIEANKSRMIWNRVATRDVDDVDERRDIGHHDFWTVTSRKEGLHRH